MAELAIADMFPAVRVLVGDGGSPAEGWDYEDDQISAAIRAVVQSGWLPCVDIKQADPNVLSPAPPNRATWGWLVAKAAHLLIGGESAVSYKTRALSVYQEASARRDKQVFIEGLLSDLDASGNVCGTADDVEYKGLFGTAADLATYCRVGCPCEPPPFFHC